MVVDIIHEESPKMIRNRTRPGFGIQLLSQFTIEKIGEKQCKVEINVDVECNWILMGKVYKDLQIAQSTLLERLKQYLQKQEQK